MSHTATLERKHGLDREAGGAVTFSYFGDLPLSQVTSGAEAGVEKRRRWSGLQPARRAVSGPTARRKAKSGALRAGALIRAARARSGLSLRAAARLIVVSAPYLAYLEAGARRPSAAVLLRIAKVLGLEGRRLFCLYNPEARALIGRATKLRPRTPEETWRRFTARARVLRRRRLPRAEMRFLRQVCMPKRVLEPEQLLFVLQGLRLAARSHF
jgi:transcriptional regulator with XRE-family HTH domain